MLKLRHGVVLAEDPLTVEVDGEARRAWADLEQLGPMRVGDELIVNTAALDLSLGSGGFDVVHVNLTRGLDAQGPAGAHVMKLNYTSIQHPVVPVERKTMAENRKGLAGIPVLVLPLHGHLAPAVWAARSAREGLRVGFVQTGGGALPGRISRDVAQLRGLGLLCGHITAGPSYGGELEAVSVAGALDAAAHRLGWDAVIAGPGPGIIGSETHLGHGGMVALDTAHCALALGVPTLVSPRLSNGDARLRHRGLSHHTKTVLGMLLAPVEVPVPAGEEDAIGAVREAAGDHHRVVVRNAPIDAYAGSGLPTRTMGRGLEDDSLFFAAALAAGTGLAAATVGDDGTDEEG